MQYGVILYEKCLIYKPKDWQFSQTVLIFTLWQWHWITSPLIWASAWSSHIFPPLTIGPVYSCCILFKYSSHQNKDLIFLVHWRKTMLQALCDWVSWVIMNRKYLEKTTPEGPRRKSKKPKELEETDWGGIQGWSHVNFFIYKTSRQGELDTVRPEQVSNCFFHSPCKQLLS